MTDHATARQVYAASRTTIEGRSAMQTAHRHDLRNRLHLAREKTPEIDRARQ